MNSTALEVKDAGPPSPFEVGRILVVDDNELEQCLISTALTGEGHSVTVLGDGLRVLDTLAADGIDLLVLDVVMPGLSGLEVLQAVRAKYSAVDVPVIMVTAKDQDEDLMRALQLGASDYIAKPVSIQVLRARVRTHMHLKRLLQQRNEFFRIASHDLRGPLTAIFGMAQAMRRMLQKTDGGVTPTNVADFTDMLSSVHQNARYMTDLLRHFVDLQSIEVGEFKVHLAPCSLYDLVHEAVTSCAAYAKEEKNVEVQMGAETKMPLVHADLDRIRQVLRNLLDNAIKFGPPGTRVAVHTSTSDGVVTVEVKDTGPGLTAADFNKVFVKHARLSNRPTGGETSTGLGLALCKSIVELHPRGAIGVRNNPDGGACFWFQLAVLE